MVERGRTRASGATVADEVMAEEVKEAEIPAGQGKDGETDRARKWRSTGLSRMKTDWNAEDRMVLDSVRHTIDTRIAQEFGDAYAVLGDIYDVVRTAAVDEKGNEIKDQFGFPVWKRKHNGDYEEDWSRLSIRQRENFLFTITTRIFEWEQRAADAWGEAMMAKALWEEKFASEFERPRQGTVDDRTAAGRIGSADERYFALFLSWYSRKADALVRTLQLIAQRLKDVLQS